MTTPKAILIGFSLVALAIASLPYSNGLIPKAQAMECLPPIELHMMRQELATITKLVKVINENQVTTEGSLQIIYDKVK